MRGASLFLVVLLAGCGSGPEFKVPPPSTTRLPRESDQPYYRRLNELSVRLLQATDLSEDVVFSPLVVGHGLALLMNGSSSSTRDELLGALDLTESNVGDFNEAQRALLNRLGGLEPWPFVSGTAVFAVWPVKFDEGYVSKMGSTYGAVVRKLGGATVEGSRLIGVWVEERVSHDYPAPKITLNKNQQLLVLGCSVFAWRPSALDEPSDVTVRKIEGGSSTCVSFEMADGIVFVAYQPVGEGRLPDLVAELGADDFGEPAWSSGAVVEGAALPALRIDSDLELIPDLRAIGIHTAFDDGANFRTMAIETESGYRISKFSHRADVSLDEIPGAERLLGGPYVFAIVDRVTGAILMLGAKP